MQFNNPSTADQPAKGKHAASSERYEPNLRSRAPILLRGETRIPDRRNADQPNTRRALALSQRSARHVLCDQWKNPHRDTRSRRGSMSWRRPNLRCTSWSTAPSHKCWRQLRCVSCSARARRLRFCRSFLINRTWQLRHQAACGLSEPTGGKFHVRLSAA
jgi:hypothetical protein